MEAWRQRPLGGEKNLTQRKNETTHLTPTGLLMEAISLKSPAKGEMSEMAMFRQLRLTRLRYVYAHHRNHFSETRAVAL